MPLIRAPWREWPGPARRPRLGAVLRSLAPYLGAAAVIGVFQVSGVAQALDLLLYDWSTSLRPLPTGRSEPIAIISIGESDLRRYGWPLDDALLCQALDRLSQAGAAAIGLDLYRDKGVGAAAACLRQRFARNSRLVSIFNVASGISAVPGTPPQRQSFNDLSLDRDGVLRRDLVHVTGQNEATVSLPLRLVEVARGDRRLRRQLESGRLAGAWLSADAGGYHREVDAGLGLQRMLVFRQPGSFASHSFSDLLAGAVPGRAIRGRIVLIGSTAASLKDLFLVPMSRFEGGSVAMTLPGVEVHALRVASLLELQDGRALPGWLMPGWGNRLLTLLMVGLGLALGDGLRSLRSSVLATAGAALLLGLVLIGLLLGQVWISASTPLLALLATAGAGWVRRGSASQQHARQVQRLLGQATSPAVAQQLWEQREELLRDGRFEGRLLPATVLFTDAANFTTVSEGLGPAALMDWLNRGMAICIPAVTRRGGMVNKFTGDGMMAVFGVPLSRDPTADARAAIEAALEIRSGLAALNTDLVADGLPGLQLRIGIHSGPVLAGSMGISERLEYAVIGDTVNCASRLESLDKQRHAGVARVLVSATTRALLGAELDGRLPWLDWGPLQVKGRAEPLLVSELQEEQRTAS